MSLPSALIAFIGIASCIGGIVAARLAYRRLCWPRSYAALASIGFCIASAVCYLREMLIAPVLLYCSIGLNMYCLQHIYRAQRAAKRIPWDLLEQALSDLIPAPPKPSEPHEQTPPGGPGRLHRRPGLRWLKRR